MTTNLNNEIYGDLPDEVTKEKKYISRFFLLFTSAFLVSYLIVFVLITLYTVAAEVITMPYNMSNAIMNFLSFTHTPLFLAFLCIFIGKKNISRHPVMSNMTPVLFLLYMVICSFFMVAGAIAGNVISALIDFIAGTNSINVVDEVITQMSIWEVILYAVILAPIFEELIFRKIFIDNLARYGTKFCILVSGLIFALYHGNFYQFFYAFILGALFAFIYSTYGKIWHTILLHAILNFMGSVVPVLLGVTEQSVNASSPGVTFYSMINILSLIVGGVFFFANVKKAKFFYVSGVLLKPGRVLLKSPGFILTLVVIVAIFAMSFVPA